MEQQKSITGSFKKFGQVRDIDKEGRSAIFALSDESVDRHNTAIYQKAWDLDAYQKNPIVAYMHETDGDFLGLRLPDPDLIIGTSEIWFDKATLMGRVFFEEGNEWADKIFRKVKNGVLRMASVGFIPALSPRKGTKDLGERPQSWYWSEEKSVELIEWSIVHIGSNRNAIMQKGWDSNLINYLTECDKSLFTEKELPNNMELERRARVIRAKHNLFKH